MVGVYGHAGLGIAAAGACQRHLGQASRANACQQQSGLETADGLNPQVNKRCPVDKATHNGAVAIGIANHRVAQVVGSPVQLQCHGNYV